MVNIMIVTFQIQLPGGRIQKNWVLFLLSNVWVSTVCVCNCADAVSRCLLTVRSFAASAKTPAASWCALAAAKALSHMSTRSA